MLLPEPSHAEGLRRARACRSTASGSVPAVSVAAMAAMAAAAPVSAAATAAFSGPAIACDGERERRSDREYGGDPPHGPNIRLRRC